MGILDALDGPLSAGAQLAINQVNAAGGIRGADGQQYHLEAVIQGPDVQGSLSTAIGNLSNAGVVAVVGPTTGDQVRNNLQALQNMNVPVLTAAIDDTLLANESTDRLFRARSAEQLHGQALANIIVRDFAITDMQTVLLDPSGTAGQVGFALAVRQLGGQLRHGDHLRPGQRDHRQSCTACHPADASGARVVRRGRCRQPVLHWLTRRAVQRDRGLRRRR
ncbi:MAG: ABC transporter substrate-binding protein [Chloroflexi bacterium]|nr:ABC transporter substrate-binding protein [Chloroflexota bacterium]